MPQLTERSGATAGSPTTTSLTARAQAIDPLVSIRAIRFTHPDSLYVRHLKRGFDLVLGGVLLVLFAPVILLAALAVAATSGLPAFYASERVGKGGKTFRMWKLRTMCRDADAIKTRWPETDPDLYAEYARHQKLVQDPRTTAVGRLLRRTSIDELPQLLNVVRGDMALVGPRPYMPAELAESPETRALVTRVRPGITGPWQVGGRNRILPDARLDVDRLYITNQGFFRDLECLLRTLGVLLRMNGI
jgi:lipopolysaccharide/colanic/teichoic acid biosynthesis glycosyltransferase